MRLSKGNELARALLLIAMMLTIAISGCGKMTDAVKGLWKTAGEAPHDFLEIGDSYIVIDERRIEGVVFDDKETSVWVRAPFTGDRALLVLTANADGSMGMQMAGAEKVQRYVRAQAGERAAELTPPIAALLGCYRDPTGDLVEIGADYFEADLARFPVKIASGKRKYQVTGKIGETDAERTLEFSIDGNGLVLCGQNKQFRLTRISAEEGAKIRERMQKERSLTNLVGFMKAVDIATGTTEIWEIGNDYLRINIDDKIPVTINYTRRMAKCDRVFEMKPTPVTVRDGKSKFDMQLTKQKNDSLWQFVVEGDKVFRLKEGDHVERRLLKIAPNEAKDILDRMKRELAAKKETLRKTLGYWVGTNPEPVVRERFNGYVDGLVITETELIFDNIRGKIEMGVVDDEVRIRYDTKEHSENYYLRVESLSADGNTLTIRKKYDSGYVPSNDRPLVYQRCATKDFFNQVRNPDLEKIWGTWIFDKGTCDSFKTIEIKADSVIFDGVKIPVGRYERRNAYIRCVVPHIRYAAFGSLPDGRLAVVYGADGDNVCYYRRGNAAQSMATLAKRITEPIENLSGYWKSDVTKIKDHKWVFLCKLAYGRNRQNVPMILANFVGCRSEYGQKPFEPFFWSRNDDASWVSPLNGDVGAKQYYIADRSYTGASVKIIDQNTIQINGRNFDNVTLKRVPKTEMQLYLQKYPE